MTPLPHTRLNRPTSRVPCGNCERRGTVPNTYSTPITSRQPHSVDEYATAVFCETIKFCGRRGQHDASDIAQAVAETFLTDAERIMARFPNPVRFARGTARYTAISFDRRERVQRGEGIRLADLGGGARAPRRRYLSGNATIADSGSELFDTLIDTSEPVADNVAHQCDIEALLARCLAGISPIDRELLMLVDGFGYSVKEVAQLVGQRRETVSRRIARIRQQVARNGAGLLTL
ncbi:MAG: sigma-70 family RNA polymerase sigma factor [Actinomycetota bacterium]